MQLIIGLLFYIFHDNKVLSADKRHPNKLKQKAALNFKRSTDMRDSQAIIDMMDAGHFICVRCIFSYLIAWLLLSGMYQICQILVFSSRNKSSNITKATTKRKQHIMNPPHIGLLRKWNAQTEWYHHNHNISGCFIVFCSIFDDARGEK